MSFFRQPKPRRFHHEPIYYDEHRDRVNRIMEKARRELREESGRERSPEEMRDTFERDIRGAFTGDVRQKRTKRHAGRFGFLTANTGAVIVIILVLLLVWLYLQH